VKRSDEREMHIQVSFSCGFGYSVWRNRASPNEWWATRSICDGIGVYRMERNRKASLVNKNFRDELFRAIPFDADDKFYADYKKGIEDLAEDLAHYQLELNDADDLVRLLNDAHLQVSQACLVISLLRLIRHAPSIEPLKIVAMSNSDISVRRAAMVALASIGRSKAYTTLKKIALTDSDPQARRAALAAISITPFKRYFSILVRVIEHDPDSSVRAEALRTISSISNIDREATYHLCMAKATDSTEDIIVRAYAIDALGSLRDKRALDFIIEQTSNEAPEIRYMSLYALGLLGNQTHIPLLEMNICDESNFPTWGTVGESAQEAIEIILERAKWQDKVDT
jgi:HEAT repeat protein